MQSLLPSPLLEPPFLSPSPFRCTQRHRRSLCEGIHLLDEDAELVCLDPAPHQFHVGAVGFDHDGRCLLPGQYTEQILVDENRESREHSAQGVCPRKLKLGQHEVL